MSSNRGVQSPLLACMHSIAGWRMILACLYCQFCSLAVTHFTSSVSECSIDYSTELPLLQELQVASICAPPRSSGVILIARKTCRNITRHWRQRCGTNCCPVRSTVAVGLKLLRDQKAHHGRCLGFVVLCLLPQRNHFRASMWFLQVGHDSMVLFSWQRAVCNR